MIRRMSPELESGFHASLESFPAVDRHLRRRNKAEREVRNEGKSVEGKKEEG